MKKHTGYKKFDIKDGLEIGDIFYKFDNDIAILPPLQLTAFGWTKKCFDDDTYWDVINGEKTLYVEFQITYPDSIMAEWKDKYGTNKRKWKAFLKDLRKFGWFYVDDLYIKKIN